jgi:hypothetical protein
MTREKKIEIIKEYCNARGDCLAGEHPECPLWSSHDNCFEDVTDEVLDRNYKTLFGEYPDEDELLATDIEPVDTEDVINHPNHYCREGGMESIDEMVLVFGKEAVANFCLCNVWKYRYRASSKNGEEDLHKSDWYMQKYKELKNQSISEIYEALKDTKVTIVDKELNSNG